MSRQRLTTALLLALLVAGVFARAGGFGFIEEYDDKQYILANPQVRSGLTLEGAAWAFTSVGGASNWHPLTWLSHMLDVQLFGLDARGHHLVSVALHAANAVLLFAVLAAMTGAPAPSAFAAALFAVHPLHVESVAWVAERKDVLSTLFMMLALGAYARYTRRPNPRRYALVALALALGLMAKPMLVTLPFVLLLLDVWPLGRLRPGAPGAWATARRLALEKVPLLLLAAASGAVTLMTQRRGASIAGLAALPLADRAANALTAYLAYLRLTLWPAGLSAFYPYEHIPLLSARVAAAAAAVAAVTAAAALWRRGQPWLATGWLWFVGTLVPVIGLVQAGDQAYADRYTYVTTIGLFVALAWGAAAVRRRLGLPRPAVAAAGLCAIAALAAAAFVQAGYWRDGVTLFTRAVALDPRNWVAHNNLGVALRNRGRDDEALGHFSQAVAIRPSYPESRYNLAILLADRGALDAAAAQYREVLRLEPGHVEARCNLGVILTRQGDLDGALFQLREAVRLRPADPLTRVNLGIVLRKRGLDAEAFGHFARAAADSPANPEARYNLAVMLAERGDLDAAARHYREAVRLKPDYQEALCNLGTILYARRDLDGAIALFREAVRLRPNDPIAAGNLSAALRDQAGRSPR